MGASGDNMNNELEEKDNFSVDEMSFNIPNYVELTDDNEFYSGKIKKDTSSIMSDSEFEELLHDLGIIDTPNESVNTSIDDLNREKELVLAKIRLEAQMLNLERKKFEKDKKEWEDYRKLSEESFQVEKEEFEKYKKLQKEKMYLETKELVDSCTNLKDFLEGYNKIHDVSE